eukprot:2624541-Rhodomonas_salina.1
MEATTQRSGGCSEAEEVSGGCWAAMLVWYSASKVQRSMPALPTESSAENGSDSSQTHAHAWRGAPAASDTTSYLRYQW